MPIKLSYSSIPEIENLQIHNTEQATAFEIIWAGEADYIRFEVAKYPGGQQLLCMDIILRSMAGDKLLTLIGLTLIEGEIRIPSIINAWSAENKKKISLILENELLKTPSNHEIRTLHKKPVIDHKGILGGRALPGLSPYIIAVNHIKRYKQTIELIQPGSILECACGTGYGASIISFLNNIGEYCGVDLSEDAVSAAKSNNNDPRINFIACDVDKIQKKKFNNVISLETIEHTPNPFSFIELLIKKIDTDGQLLLSIPTEIWGGSHLNPDHWSNWNHQRVVNFVSQYFNEIVIYKQKLSLQGPTIFESSGISLTPQNIENDEGFYIQLKKPKLNKKPNIVIIRKNALGDVIWITPILATLRDEYPNHNLIVVTRKTEVFISNPHADLVVTPDYLPLEDDRIINLDFSYENQRNSHIIDAYAKTARINIKYKKPSLFLLESQASLIRTTLNNIFPTPQRRLLAIHMAATSPNRIWPKNYWQEFVTSLLAQDSDIGIVVLGSGNDFSAEQIGLSSHRILCLTRKLNLMQTAAALKNCELLIAPDSGVMHIAAAMETPVLGLFGMANPDTRMPFDPYSKSIWSDIDCKGCINDIPPHAPPLCKKTISNCMEKITPQEVINKTNQILAKLQNEYPLDKLSDNPLLKQNYYSFIICSVDNKKFTKISSRIEELVSSPHEIIRITDAKSLSQGYTDGLAKSQGNIIIFCHDDIDFLCGENFIPRLANHLKNFDIVGVAGTNKVSSPFWLASGPTSWAGLVIHHRQDNNFELTVFDNSRSLIKPVQALDGVFIAMQRDVASNIKFDAKNFDGFHCYDIDFTYRCHQAGYKIGACKNLLLVHESSGNFGEDWRKYAERFINKFPEFDINSLDSAVIHKPACVIVRTEDEARSAVNGLLNGFINPTISLKTVGINDDGYELLKSRKSMQEIDGEILAEHLVKWKSKPLFNITLEVHEGEQELLADTLDSIAAQWYSNWHLTIVADFPPTSPELAEISQITWIESRNQAKYEQINHAVYSNAADWIFLLEVGCTLEPHALAYFGDTINAYPHSKLIYVDEDQGCKNDKTCNPRFKPDFNLEMLRCTYYIGPALLINKSSFTLLNGLAYQGITGYYDIALKCTEITSDIGITHLPEILIHTPAIGLRPFENQEEQDVVKAHLARLNIDASINNGLLNGTQSVIYKTKKNLFTSIIIISRDQPGYLAHCIESLINETNDSNFEIILVAHKTTDPDALLYINELASGPRLKNRFSLIINNDEFNYANLCNIAAKSAHGDAFLFLDNDIEFIQADWLSRLLGYIAQENIAAVSPRLSAPDGSFSKINQGFRILGMGTCAGSGIPENTNIIDRGYFGNLQVAQEVSAIAGSAFMIKSSIFNKLGGFDIKNTPIHEPVLEICLRIKKLNKKIIWTPWVDLVHHNKITRRRLASQSETQQAIELSANKEWDFLLTNYLDILASDPYYHRQLSLQKPFTIETNAFVEWDTRFHDRLRVLGLPLTSGSGEYRMSAPFRCLQIAGLAQANIVYPVGHKIQRVLTPTELARTAPDVLMLQQAIDDVQILQLKRYKRFLPDIFVTYAVDDVLGSLPRKHYLYNYQAREGKSRMREGLSYCDRLIASTEPIADYCRDMIDDIIVVPNRLEKKLWGDLSSRRGAGEKPRVGWAGAQQHLGDLELIKTVVESLAHEVEWIFMGMCPEFLKPYVKEEHPFVSFSDYPQKLASLNLDLAIAPLEQNLFNEGKSNLRLLEYGAMGWPVICTDIYPYQTNNAPVLRLPNEASRWIDAIRERINDLDATYREGDLLKRWVFEHYMLEDHLKDWLAAVTPTKNAQKSS